MRKQRGREWHGLDEKGPNLFSGQPSTPSPAKSPTTVWPSSYNPYYTKRTERPPPPSEERVERPEQKLRGGQSTGEACILSSGPPSPGSFFRFTLVSLCFSSIFFQPLYATMFRTHRLALSLYHAKYTTPPPAPFFPPRPLCYYYALFCTMHPGTTGSITPSAALAIG